VSHLTYCECCTNLVMYTLLMRQETQFDKSQWKDFYFVLFGGALYYYKDSKVHHLTVVPPSLLDALNECVVVRIM